MSVITEKKFHDSCTREPLLVSKLRGMTIKPRWTNPPYQLHCNVGDEVVVLDGQIKFGDCVGGEEKSVLMRKGDNFHAEVNCKYNVTPIDEAHILVIEKGC